MAGLEHLGVGTVLFDSRTGRTLVLQSRVNPMGKLIPAYWTVLNTGNGRRTVIRESRILTGRRFTRA